MRLTPFIDHEPTGFAVWFIYYTQTAIALKSKFN
jgi:hypothetical protein